MALPGMYNSSLSPRRKSLYGRLADNAGNTYNFPPYNGLGGTPGQLHLGGGPPYGLANAPGAIGGAFAQHFADLQAAHDAIMAAHPGLHGLRTGYAYGSAPGQVPPPAPPPAAPPASDPNAPPPPAPGPTPPPPPQNRAPTTFVDGNGDIWYWTGGQNGVWQLQGNVAGNSGQAH